MAPPTPPCSPHQPCSERRHAGAGVPEVPAGPGDPVAGGALQGLPSQGQVCLWVDPAAGGFGQRTCGAKGWTHLGTAVWLCLCTATTDHSKLLSGEPQAKSDSTIFAWIQSREATYSVLCLRSVTFYGTFKAWGKWGIVLRAHFSRLCFPERFPNSHSANMI